MKSYFDRQLAEAHQVTEADVISRANMRGEEPDLSLVGKIELFYMHNILSENRVSLHLMKIYDSELDEFCATPNLKFIRFAGNIPVFEIEPKNE